MSGSAYAASVGSGPTWRHAVRTCLAGLPSGEGGAGIGLVYVSGQFGDVLDLVVEELQRHTGLAAWFGASTRDVLGGVPDGPAGDGRVGAMLTPWPADGASFFADASSDRTGKGPAGRFSILHADERVRRREGEPIAVPGTFAIGGVGTGRSTLRIAGGPVEGEVAGVVLDPAVEVLSGIAQGCAPIGPHHRISAARGAWLLGLDDRPAFQVLSDEMGELLVRRPDRIGRYIYAAHPDGESDGRRNRVRPILAVEPREGAIAVTAPLRVGERIRFVKPDVRAARRSFEGLLDELTARLAGRPPRAAFLILSAARGRRGDPDLEVDLVRARYGALPLVGIRTDDEIFAGRLHSLSAVLALMP